MTEVGSYDHLNEGFAVNIDMQDLANQILAENYGLHRMLSALVRAGRDKQSDEQERVPDIKAKAPLIDKIEEALNTGLYH